MAIAVGRSNRQRLICLGVGGGGVGGGGQHTAGGQRPDVQLQCALLVSQSWCALLLAWWILLLAECNVVELCKTDGSSMGAWRITF